MLQPRVIPCLLMDKRALVKGVNFKKHQYIGDPINAVQIFSRMEPDEIMLLDIKATFEKRIPSLSIIQKIADQCLVPFTVGGGITGISDIRKILKIGAEKVCLNTSALEKPFFIKKASSVFGSQSIVVSIDVLYKSKGKYEVYSRCGTNLVSDDLSAVLHLIEESGAGEILINSIDRDGTMKGYDIELIKTAVSEVKIPVIACGGAGSIKDLKEGINKGHASAVAAGSMFVFHGKRRAVLINFPLRQELSYIKNENL